MSNYLAATGLNFKSSGPFQARHDLLGSAPWDPLPTSAVSYVAGRKLLIIGEMEQASRVTELLGDRLSVHIAIPADRSGLASAANAHHAAGLTVKGFLGQFEVLIDQHLEQQDPGEQNLAKLFDIESGFFDQVWDCRTEPCFTSELKPPGYYNEQDGADIENQIDRLETVPDMVGEFEKPRYFDYNPDICAHGRSGIRGCTNCLDACPADAIISIGDSIEVNPYLCQGGGVCATSCPTSAITYAYPRADQHLELLRVLVKGMLKAYPDTAPEVVFVDNEHGIDRFNEQFREMVHTVLPFVVEEIGSVGPEMIASALAYGAGRVFIYTAEGTPAKVIETLEKTVGQIDAVLEETSCSDRTLSMGDTLEGVGVAVLDSVAKPATYAPVSGKRAITRKAYSHFNEIAEQPRELFAMPEGSMFGRIRVDTETCTLCMGCVSQCPGNALQAGGDTPALRFIEANCVQCGICQESCPESSITLEPRLHFDLNVISKPIPIKEESPFHCIVCGKPFATQAMIARMTDKLKGHWMFDDAGSLNRLRMCGDCRVVDMLEEENRKQT